MFKFTARLIIVVQKLAPNVAIKVQSPFFNFNPMYLKAECRVNLIVSCSIFN